MCIGSFAGVWALSAPWHFGVGIHSLVGRGGGSRACRVFGRVFRTGRGGFGWFLGLRSVEFISAIFSPIGAFLTELQPFLYF